MNLTPIPARRCWLEGCTAAESGRRTGLQDQDLAREQTLQTAVLPNKSPVDILHITEFRIYLTAALTAGALPLSYSGQIEPHRA
jgi:hypothetical protein